MRGSVARALRKEVGFNPNAKREYTVHEVTVIRPILSYNHEEKRAEIVKRPVSAFIEECTDGARSFYQYLKKKWVRPDYEMVLNQLPEVDELAKLAREVLSDEEVVEDLKSKNKTLDDLTDGVSPQDNDVESEEADGGNNE